MSPQRPLIVVVDDAEEIREILEMILQRDGFRVVACSTAQAAFEAVRSERPALVITDLMLGVSSGLDLITRLRSDLAPPVPPILACSGFEAFEAEALERGASAFFPKPFDVETVLRSVRTLLAHQVIEKDTRAQAGRRAVELRAQAARLANAAFTRLAPRMDDLSRRSAWTTHGLPRYFGFGEAFDGYLRGGELRVTTASNEQHWPLDHPLGLPLCRDIIETASALMVPDLASLGAAVSRPDGVPLRFFAGVPILCGSVAIGALCLVDERPRRFDAEGFSILEALGRRASSLLSEVKPSIAPVFTPSGLVSREALRILLLAELSRTAREQLTMFLFVCGGGRPRLCPLPERTAIAELSDNRFAVLITRPDGPEERREMMAIIRELGGAEDFLCGGLLTIEGGAVPALDEQHLVRTVEELFERALLDDDGTIERLVIRRELFVTEPVIVEE